MRYILHNLMDLVRLAPIAAAIVAPPMWLTDTIMHYFHGPTTIAQDQDHHSEHAKHATPLPSPLTRIPLVTDLSPPVQPTITIRISYSPNYTPRRKRTIDTVVIHDTEGTGTSAENTFTNPASGVSAHYLIMENGEIVQFVDEKDTAWHAGKSFWKGKRNINPNSIGIELAGYAGKAYAESQYRSLHQLLKPMLVHYRLSPSDVVGHSDISPGRKQDPGSAFEWLQVRQSLH